MAFAGCNLHRLGLCPPCAAALAQIREREEADARHEMLQDLFISDREI